MIIETQYNIGDMVILKTDPEQRERIICGIVIRPNNSVLYYLCYMGGETQHYDFEITEDIDVLKTLNY